MSHNLDVDATVEHVAKVGNIELVRYMHRAMPDKAQYREFVAEVADGLRESGHSELADAAMVLIKPEAQPEEALEP